EAQVFIRVHTDDFNKVLTCQMFQITIAEHQFQCGVFNNPADRVLRVQHTNRHRNHTCTHGAEKHHQELKTVGAKNPDVIAFDQAFFDKTSGHGVTSVMELGVAHL